MSRTRIAIVDDEEPARMLLGSLVAARTDLELVGTAIDGASAIELIRDAKPELVLLDIQMPRVDGFDVIEAVGPNRMPLVVFVTAHQEFALQAFEAQAFDYLLKPLDRERFNLSLDRAIKRLAADSLQDIKSRFELLLESVRSGPMHSVLPPFALKVDGSIRLIGVDTIVRMEADSDYVRVTAGHEAYHCRETLSSVEARLPPGRFIRIHRSVIVNVAHIKEIRPYMRGELVVTMRDGARFVTGRTYRERLRPYLAPLSPNEANP